MARFYAQNILTGEWLDRDVPLTDPEVTWGLNGGDTLRATITPELARMKTDDGSPLLNEWGTALYLEESGQIRWGGIVTNSEFVGPDWHIDVDGFCIYPTGIPYNRQYRMWAVDPLDVVRDIWDYIQRQPDGDLGLIVDDTTTTETVGDKEPPPKPTRRDGESRDHFQDRRQEWQDEYGQRQRYELLWWEAPDLGQEISNLATQTPVDFWEEHTWTDDSKESVTHRLRFGFPRRGRRQHNLRFVEGENVAEVVGITRDGMDYANEVIGLGAGEGRKMKRSRMPQRDGRLRRVAVFTDKSIRHQGRLDALTRKELVARRNLPEITRCSVWDHPNAQLGSFGVGDDILVQASAGWADQAIWSRITGITRRIDTGHTELTLARSDTFTYRGGAG